MSMRCERIFPGIFAERRRMVSLKELEGWLSTGQAARALGRSRQGVIDLAEARHLRAVKTAAGWLYDPKSVSDFAAEQEDIRAADEARAELARGEDEMVDLEEALP